MTYEGFAALAEPTRRQVFERLASGPLPVGRIARGLPVSRPAVSQHLKVLQEARLVSVERVGTRRLYQIDHRGVQAMQRYLERFWDHSLAAFKTAAEEEPPK